MIELTKRTLLKFLRIRLLAVARKVDSISQQLTGLGAIVARLTEIERQNAEILTKLDALADPAGKHKLTVTGGEIMYTLPNDHPDVPYTIAPLVVTDAEGETIPTTVTFTSTAPDVVGVAGDELSGVLKVGHSGVATLNYVGTAKVGKDSVIVKSGAANFTITTGAVGTVSGGEFTFDGITEDPAA